MKQGTDLFEVLRHSPRACFAGITRYHEVRGSELNPWGCLFICRVRAPSGYQDQKNSGQQQRSCKFHVFENVVLNPHCQELITGLFFCPNADPSLPERVSGL